MTLDLTSEFFFIHKPFGETMLALTIPVIDEYDSVIMSGLGVK